MNDDCWKSRGSKLQVQIYVNLLPEDLSGAIIDAVPSLQERRPHPITWRSPLEEQGCAEYRDREFLQALGLGHLSDELAAFWPAGGPRWDALGTTTLALGAQGVVLVEGKSYPGEMYGRGARAGEAESLQSKENRERIVRALHDAQVRLRLPDPDGERWTGPLYQTANRLAHLLWLDRMGVEAWLVHLLFVDDPIEPTSEEQWRTALAQVDEDLGLVGVDLPHVAHVFLPARDELRPDVGQSSVP